MKEEIDMGDLLHNFDAVEPNCKACEQPVSLHTYYNTERGIIVVCPADNSVEEFKSKDANIEDEVQ